MKKNRKPISRTEIVYQISLGGVTLSLSFLFLYLSSILPGMFICIILFIPLLLSIFSYKTNYKYQLVYLICLAFCTFIDPILFLFYLLPNTLIGLLCGNLYKLKLPDNTLFLSNLLLSFALNVASLFLLKLIFNVDSYQILASLLNLDYQLNFELIINLTNITIFSYSILTNYLIYYVFKNNIRKFITDHGMRLDPIIDLNGQNKISIPRVINIILNICYGLISLILIFSLCSFNSYISIVLTCFFILLGLDYIFAFIEEKKILIINFLLMGLFLVIGFIVTSLIDQKLYYLIFPIVFTASFLTYTISRIIYLIKFNLTKTK